MKKRFKAEDVEYLCTELISMGEMFGGVVRIEGGFYCRHFKGGSSRCQAFEPKDPDRIDVEKLASLYRAACEMMGKEPIGDGM